MQILNEEKLFSFNPSPSKWELASLRSSSNFSKKWNFFDRSQENWTFDELFISCYSDVIGIFAENEISSAPSYNFSAIFCRTPRKLVLTFNLFFQGTGMFINTKFFCRVCALLHDPKMRDRGEFSSYKDVNDWWRKPGTCINGSWEKYRKAVEADERKKSKEKKEEKKEQEVQGGDEEEEEAKLPWKRRSAQILKTVAKKPIFWPINLPIS